MFQLFLLLVDRLEFLMIMMLNEQNRYMLLEFVEFEENLSMIMVIQVMVLEIMMKGYPHRHHRFQRHMVRF